MMRKSLFAAILALTCCSRKAEEPVMMLRLAGENTESSKQWSETFKAISENPGCCDEVWFSSGLDMQPTKWHREQAMRMKEAAAQLDGIGIGFSVQIQTTIGHGDSYMDAGDDRYAAKTWTGWTGSTGVEDRQCTCPRQAAFLEYISETARIYSSLHPYRIWIDDDLRFENHVPATNGSRIGCWCDTCIAAFNARYGGEWTRTALDSAMKTDTALERSWRTFSISSLTHVAAAIAKAVHETSPETGMGFQHTFNPGLTDVISEIVDTLRITSGKPVAYRPGGSDYYDWNGAAGQVRKSMDAADFKRVMGNPESVDTWVPEITGCPRMYGSRTAQSVLVEAFTALAYGMDAVSFYCISAGSEKDSVYSYFMLGPISEGADVLRRYASANRGTSCVGYETERSLRTETARYAVPVLIGEGKALGRIGKTGLDPRTDNTDAFLKMRESYPAPAVCCSPYFGLLVPRITPEGTLRTVGLLNTRIDSQWRIRLRLENIPEGIGKVTWREMKKKPVELALEKENGKTYVTIPEVGAWNGGFIDIE